MFLLKNTFHSRTQTIRGVQYTVVSFYNGDKDIFEKVGDLISQSFQSSKLDEITNESLLDSGMAIPED